MDREQVLFRLFGKYFPEGAILYTEGSPGEELYVIQSGAVRLGAASRLGPGDLLGEEAFFGRAARSARAEVVQDTRLIEVSDRTLDSVIRHGPQTARGIVERLLVLAGGARRELTAWTIEQILGRVAPHLTAAAGSGIDPADLAERSGLVEADVLLALQELVRHGCLVVRGAVYLAPDAALLQREVGRLTSAGERA